MAISPAKRTPMERRPRLEAASESVMSKSFSGVSKEDLKRRGTRYVQPEHGAPAIFLDELERPSVGSGDGRAEGKAQTGATILGRSRAVRPSKSRKQPGAIFWRDAWSVIRHLDVPTVAGRISAQSYGRPVTGVPACVVDQVVNHTPQ